MDDPAEEDADWSPCQPDTLVQGLRCPVCLDYFSQPHTLTCGHSFCLRCLRTLAKITRANRSYAPLDRLRLRCPSCRKMTPARPILRRKASVNYALKELVNCWFDSPYATGTVEYVSMRSVASQTDEETKPSTKSSLNKKEGDSEVDSDTETDKEDEDDISLVQYRRILYHNIQPRTDVLKRVDVDTTIDASTGVITFTSEDENNLSDDNVVTSSSEEDSEPEFIPPLLIGDLRVINDDQGPQRRRHLSLIRMMSLTSVLGLFLAECAILWRGIASSRSRVALTVFWFIYGGLVVYVSRGFFPWMAIYTVIYFVILYTDISHPANI